MVSLLGVPHAQETYMYFAKQPVAGTSHDELLLSSSMDEHTTESVILAGHFNMVFSRRCWQQ